MWFRLSGGGGHSTANDNNCAATSTNANTPTPSPPVSEGGTSRFEKFRRASFRRKSSTAGPPVRKRSKSPHAILKADAPIREEVVVAVAAAAVANTSPVVYKSEADILLGADDRRAELYVPLSDIAKAPPSKTPNHKVALTTLKTMKSTAVPPPLKHSKTLHKPFNVRRQNSYDALKANNSRTRLHRIADVEEHDEYETDESSDDTSDDDDDEDHNDDDDDDDVDNAQSTAQRKEKILLTDPKYKNNRIEKSASKTKVSDLDKRESLKRSRSARKIPTISVASGPEPLNAKDKNKVGAAAAASAAKERAPRSHTNLNLQTLMKFVMNNKKFLSATEDFAFIRRKSISEAASTVFAVAATCKPLPIALKYTQDAEIAQTPMENDAKTERNVVLVKKQNLKNSFCDRLNNNNNNNQSSINNNLKLNKKDKDGKKVKRNSSDSSKSSGNFEDEAFYSCDEQELRNADAASASSNRSPSTTSSSTTTTTTTTFTSDQSSPDELLQKRKTSSPSLTSRVAAKINEKTTNYKNRKAAAAAASKASKKRKTNASNNCAKRPELYKQISVERLHSSSIVRQPSDRRPDGVNISQRSNGNLSHNNADLQSSFHGSGSEGMGGGGSSGDAGASSQSGHVGGGTAGSASCAGANSAAGGSNAVGATPAISAADANAQDADGKDARRERLHQQHQQNKSAPVLVNRSESYKERISQKRNRNSRRKTSDPSLTSRPNDEQPDVGLSNSKYTASSNSSLSSAGGSESPSTSMEQVAGGGGGGPSGAVGGPVGHHHSHSLHGPHHAYQHSHQDSFHSNASSSFWGSTGPMAPLARQWNIDSDDDDDLNEVDWSSNVTHEILTSLTDAEKKRQEIINEIYQTERSHVRTLKLLERLFFGPLQESGVLSHDHLMLLFPPALLSLRDLHSAFEQKLKQRRLEHNHVVQHLGDLLACMFDSPSANELCEFAAQFCARQQIALEALKEKRRKDEQLAKLLTKAESHKACRRLQLKDLLPTVLQRLTKYPLLFENLYKVTIRVMPENTSEADAIKRAVESSKKILVDVNQAVKTAEDAFKLQNIQKKLGKSELEDLKNLDLTQYRLIHDGSLEMKKNSSIRLHGLLFEDMIVLLTKQDDKYFLRNLHSARNTEVNQTPVSPIMKIDSEILIRQEAADKNSFFLIKTKTSQMLELRAPSSSECKTWFKHISDAAEQYKPRSKNANQEPVDDPAIATLPNSNTRESLELTPERPPPMAAQATVSTTPLAPMMPIATVSTTHAHGYNPQMDVQMRSSQRDNMPVPPEGLSAAAYHKQRLSHNEMSSSGSSSVNRTMSTRSCDSNHHYANNESSLNGVTLRHTQSARQANGENGNAAGGSSKRDSASIVYSNNSNDTRTLMQSGPQLVEPTAIQISISPAHTAEPVLTPAERLRRLDASIRDGLLEKQKIICDMFRLPVEHFHEIVDIAGMPEAPKDSADIALAAYAQVQSLTEVLNEYMHATPEQEVLMGAASSSVCDQCHEKQHRHQTEANTATATNAAAKKADAADMPPPLPPPNKQSSQVPKLKKAQQQTPSPSVTKLQTHALDEADIHEDDDGYCEIDELRLPSLPNLTTTKATPQPQMPTSASHPKAPAAAPTATPSPTTASPPELVKRQSTISAESIPEESADEVTEAMDESPTLAEPSKEKESSLETPTTDPTDQKLEKTEGEPIEEEKSNTPIDERQENEDTKTAKTKEAIEKDQNAENKEDASSSTEILPTSESDTDKEAKQTEKQESVPETEKEDKVAESKENDKDNAVNTILQNSLETLETLNQLAKNVSTVDNMTQTRPVALSLTTHTPWTNTNGSVHLPPCGQNRIQHANTVEPSVPCYALNTIVSALNSQISLLLPKINERDMERERLRKENQHLRELLNAMHERQRVEAKSETPTDIRTILSGALDADEDIDGYSTNSTTPTPTPPGHADDLALKANASEAVEAKAAKE